MIHIVTIICLFIIWYLNKTSKNDYFKNPKREDYNLIISLYKNFELSSDSFVKAWIYFIDFPEDYNGTSIINDRYMIKGLEPFSVTHDYAWITAKSFKDLYRSNLEYCKCLRKVNSNWLWVWAFIFIGLNLVSLFKSIKYI